MFFGDITIEYMSHFSKGQKTTSSWLLMTGGFIKMCVYTHTYIYIYMHAKQKELYRCLLESRHMTVFIVLESLIGIKLTFTSDIFIYLF